MHLGGNQFAKVHIPLSWKTRHSESSIAFSASLGKVLPMRLAGFQQTGKTACAQFVVWLDPILRPNLRPMCDMVGPNFAPNFAPNLFNGRAQGMFQQSGPTDEHMS